MNNRLSNPESGYTPDTSALGIGLVEQPAYARTPECPAWCQVHQWDDKDGVVFGPIAGHEATLTRGELALTLAWWPKSGGPRVDLTPEYLDLSAEQATEYAALLTEAAGILEQG